MYLSNIKCFYCWKNHFLDYLFFQWCLILPPDQKLFHTYSSELADRKWVGKYASEDHKKLKSVLYFYEWSILPLRWLIQDFRRESSVFTDLGGKVEFHMLKKTFTCRTNTAIRVVSAKSRIIMCIFRIYKC